MSYIVLSRKWRPEDFDQVVGQNHITKVLSNALNLDKISHSYLFSGPRGVGKTTVARILAKRLNNLDNINSSLDVIELDGASNRGIDEIRDLKDSINYVPVNGKYKVFIIDEAHMLTKEAFNALLKTLEEPPAHAVFILATTENQKIPLTISSRCQKYEFSRISVQDIVVHLDSILQKEGYEREEKALKSIALKADGSLRDALSILDKVIALSDKSITYEITASTLGIIDQKFYLNLVKEILSEDIGACMKSIESVIDSGVSSNSFLEGFIKYIRDSICYIVIAKNEFNLSEDSMMFLNENKNTLSVFKNMLNLSIESLNSHNNLNSIEIENLFFKFFKINVAKNSSQKKESINSNSLKIDKEKKQANNPDRLDSKPSQELLDIYKERIKKIESENIRIYCVLEKVKVIQLDSSTLQFDCLELSKYDKNLLSDNINSINKDLSDMYGGSVTIKMNDSDSQIQKSEESESVESEGIKSSLPEDQSSIKDKKSKSEKNKEHPLIDIAINDYNGKIIK